MAINERLIHTAADAAGGAASTEQGLILHLDANDVDSYDGDGSVWYDISEHDVTIPLSDNADNLELHLNASDSNSYGGSGTTWTDLTSNNNATVVASTYDIDNGGYFDITSNTVTFSSNTSALDTATFSFEMWVYQTSNSGTQYLFSDTGISLFTISGTQMRFIKGFSGTNNDDSYFNPTLNSSGWATNKWNHIAVTFSSTTSKVYINGVLVQTHTEGSGTPTALTTLQISPSLGRWNGYLSAFRVYDITLSASEVGQNYRHGRDYIYTDLNSNSDLFLHYDPADTNSYSGTGTTLTDLVGNNNADLLGGIESGWDEELGNSFPITGSGDGITTSNAVSINPATDGMTIEMWVKVKTDVQNYLFSFDGTNTTYFGLSYRSNTDKITWFYRNSGGSTSAVNSDTIVLNEWTHIVATTNGSSAQFYTNGVLSEETSSSAYNYTYNEDLHFGNMYDLAQNSNSDIGQIRFYKGGLTADEVMQNFNFTKNNYPNGFDGTISNTTWSSGGYFDFNGSSSIIDLPDVAAFDRYSEIKAVSAWVKLDTTTSRVFPLSISSTTNSNDYWYFGWLADLGKIYVATRDGSSSNQSFATAAVTADTNWHHIFCQVTDTTREIYLDGVSQTVTHTKAGTGTNTSWIDYPSYATNAKGAVGVLRKASPSYSNGFISKLKVYDKTLTQAEITALYNEGE